MKKNSLFKALLHEPSSLLEEFHTKTKIKKTNKNISNMPWPKEWTTIYYKSYPRMDEYRLPEPILPKVSLKEIHEKRQSKRLFSPHPLSLSKISTLLYYSAGLKDMQLENSRRFYPSAGGRYPLEVYFLSLNTDLQRGLYHYYPRNHSLEQLLPIDSFNFSQYFIASPPNDWITTASSLVIISAIFKRNTIKYKDRGYRHIMAEVGHIAQNFYLNSHALNLSCCAIGGYYENKLEQLLDIDGLDESIVYVLALGNTKVSKDSFLDIPNNDH